MSWKLADESGTDEAGSKTDQMMSSRVDRTWREMLANKPSRTKLPITGYRTKAGKRSHPEPQANALRWVSPIEEQAERIEVVAAVSWLRTS